MLFETPESVSNIDSILAIEGIDEAFIGLNDLSIGYKKKFLFELLADGTVEKLCNIFKSKGLPYGFGGIASLGKGLLPSEYIIKEHYRLGSSGAILSRSFCNTSNIQDINEINRVFGKGLKDIREFETHCENATDFLHNKDMLSKIVKKIAEDMV